MEAPAKFHLTLQHFRRSQEGINIIQQEIPFCLGGRLYQGYRGTTPQINERQLSDSEIVSILDVDGTLSEVLAARKARRGGRDLAKDRELEKKRIEKQMERKNLLELKKLEQEMGPDALDTSKPVMVDSKTFVPQNPPAESVDMLKEKILELEAQLVDARRAEVKEAAATGIICPECKKPSPAEHRNPKMWLRGHMVHHKGRRGKKAS